MDILLLIVGLGLILAGANFLTDGSAAVAQRFRVPEFIIGLTIVAVGTSMPELVVSVLSAAAGNSDVAIGNVVGSNLFNVFLILGVCALIRPLPLTQSNIRRDIPFGMAASLILLAVTSDRLICAGAADRIGRIDGIELGVPVSINIDNGIAAMALAQIAGADTDEIRRGMQTYSGVDRRFDFKIKNSRHVLLSDYAHHPAEIRQSILSLREVFNGRRLTGIFQPHLYTRTRDFYHEFADSLSLLDDVIILDIYPAREQPIEGVTSRLIYDNLRPGMPKRLCHKEDLPALVDSEDFDVLAVLGAGDADNYMDQLKAIIEAKEPRP